MSPTASWLAECHGSLIGLAPPLPDGWYEALRALMLTAALAERYGMSDAHFERLCSAIRAARETVTPVSE